MGGRPGLLILGTGDNAEFSRQAQIGAPARPKTYSSYEKEPPLRLPLATLWVAQDDGFWSAPSIRSEEWRAELCKGLRRAAAALAGVSRAGDKTVVARDWIMGRYGGRGRERSEGLLRQIAQTRAGEKELKIRKAGRRLRTAHVKLIHARLITFALPIADRDGIVIVNAGSVHAHILPLVQTLPVGLAEREDHAPETAARRSDRIFITAVPGDVVAEEAEAVIDERGDGDALRRRTALLDLLRVQVAPYAKSRLLETLTPMGWI